jgi:hypothetical protein
MINMVDLFISNNLLLLPDWAILLRIKGGGDRISIHMVLISVIDQMTGEGRRKMS